MITIQKGEFLRTPWLHPWSIYTEMVRYLDASVKSASSWCSVDLVYPQSSLHAGSIKAHPNWAASHAHDAFDNIGTEHWQQHFKGSSNSYRRHLQNGCTKNGHETIIINIPHPQIVYPSGKPIHAKGKTLKLDQKIQYLYCILVNTYFIFCQLKFLL